jgi:hypothetical protein
MNEIKEKIKIQTYNHPFLPTHPFFSTILLTHPTIIFFTNH